MRRVCVFLCGYLRIKCSALITVRISYLIGGEANYDRRLAVAVDISKSEAFVCETGENKALQVHYQPVQRIVNLGANSTKCLMINC